MAQNDLNENRWEMITHHNEGLREFKFDDCPDVKCVIDDATDILKLIVRGEVVNEFNYVEQFGGIGLTHEDSKLEAYLNVISRTIQSGLIYS